MKLITLQKEDNILLKDTITDYSNPNYIYLPITMDANFKIAPKSYIHRGDLLYDLTYSPISGKILGLRECYSTAGFSKFLVIQNDFKEKTSKKLGVRKNFNMSKEEFLDLLSKYDNKLLNLFNNSFNKIIVNSIEEQPYVGNFMYINMYYSKETLDMLDALSDIFNINDIKIVLKDTDYNSVNSLNNIIGMYPNISLQFLPDKYLISRKENLDRYLNLKDNYLYLNLDDVYSLYQYIKRRKIKEEQIITITGNAIENPQVIKCKVGTSLYDLINSVIKIKDTDFVTLVSSLFNNQEIDYKRFIITNDLKVIYIMKKRSLEEHECIKCGKCNEICPVDIKVSNLVKNRPCNILQCVHCGLCTYICPSFININKYLDGDNHE